jgi:hypothetical protein
MSNKITAYLPPTPVRLKGNVTTHFKGVIEIDVQALGKELLEKAARNRSRKSSLAGGLITVSVIRAN